jgi:hypothetical protein
MSGVLSSKMGSMKQLCPTGENSIVAQMATLGSLVASRRMGVRSSSTSPMGPQEDDCHTLNWASFCALAMDQNNKRFFV